MTIQCELTLTHPSGRIDLITQQEVLRAYFSNWQVLLAARKTFRNINTMYGLQSLQTGGPNYPVEIYLNRWKLVTLGRSSLVSRILQNLILGSGRSTSR